MASSATSHRSGHPRPVSGAPGVHRGDDREHRVRRSASSSPSGTRAAHRGGVLRFARTIAGRSSPRGDRDTGDLRRRHAADRPEHQRELAAGAMSAGGSTPTAAEVVRRPPSSGAAGGQQRQFVAIHAFPAQAVEGMCRAAVESHAAGLGGIPRRRHSRTASATASDTAWRYQMPSQRLSTSGAGAESRPTPRRGSRRQPGTMRSTACVASAYIATSSRS